jgi:branched-chain amino acid transport system permease protein
MSMPALQRTRSWRTLAAITLAGTLTLLLLPYVLSTYHLGLVIQMMIFALFAMSLDLLIGYAGMASLGHAAYFGAAAYATGLLALRLGWSVWLALPAGLLLAALIAALFGLLALRTRGSYFLMITLALSQVVWGIAFGWRSLTGGDDGLPEVPRPDLHLPWSLADSTPFYYFALVLVAAGALLLMRIVSSPFGYALRGIRESETRMLALGYDVWRYKLAAFVLAATFAGLSGCLYVYYNRFVSPDYLQVARSAEVLLMVVLGGAGTLVGPAIGAALIVLLQNVISGYTERWLLVLGVVYVLVALFAPRGLVGLVRDLHAKRAKP